MATQGVAGRKGRLTLAASSASTASRVLEMTEYNLIVEGDLPDASSNDSSGWNETIGGVYRQWTLSWSLLATTANWNAGTAADIADSMSSKGLRWVTVYPTTSSTANCWRGYAVAESLEISGDYGDVMRVEAVYQGHRALTYTS